MTWDAIRRAVAALGLGLALAAPVAAGARPPGHPGDLLARHAERLGLDAETQAAIQEIVDDWGTRDAELRDEIERARARLHELLAQKDTDEAAVLAQQDALAALYAESHRRRLIATLRIHERLTPEQREELVRIRSEEGPPHRVPSRGACRDDLQSRCAGAAGAAALRCLAEHWDDLDADCRDVLERVGREPWDGPGR
jgi:Spy/CpxP family protein refolding chaperone